MNFTPGNFTSQIISFISAKYFDVVYPELEKDIEKVLVGRLKSTLQKLAIRTQKMSLDESTLFIDKGRLQPYDRDVRKKEFFEITSRFRTLSKAEMNVLEGMIRICLVSTSPVSLEILEMLLQKKVGEFQNIIKKIPRLFDVHSNLIFLRYRKQLLEENKEKQADFQKELALRIHKTVSLFLIPENPQIPDYFRFNAVSIFCQGEVKEKCW